MASSSSIFLPPSLPNPILSRSTTSSFFFPKAPLALPLPQLRKPLSAKSVASPEIDTSLPPAIHTFWQWLLDEGVISSKTPVKPGIVPEGLGLVALRDISRNDVVLQVPKRLWINPDAVASSEIGNVCSGLKPWVSVALFLVRERGRDDSLWKHYFRVLPELTDSTIYWWVGFPFHCTFWGLGFWISGMSW